MFCHKCKCCTPMWFAGFFAFPALAQLIRLVTKTQVLIGPNAKPVPMTVSIVIAVVAIILSIVFCKMSCKACNCGTTK